MTRLRVLTGLCAGAVLLSACGAGVTASPSSSPPSSTSTAPTAAGNRVLAQQVVDRLVREAPLPPGSVALADPPARLRELTDGHAIVRTALVTQHAYWRVPLPQAQAARWFRQHPTLGFGLYMDGTSGVPNGQHLQDLSFRGPDAPAYDQLGLDVDIAAAGAAASSVRIGGSAFWLDPAPRRDDAAGTRWHLTVSDACPVTPGDAVGVRNEGPAVTDALVPAQAPTRGLVCDYGHGAFHRWAPVKVERLDATAAAREAETLRALPLAHPPTGAVQPRSCPPGLMLPTPTRVVVLAFEGRPDVAVWDARGCGRWTANGWVAATS